MIGGEGSGKTTTLLHWLQERLESAIQDEWIVLNSISEDSLCPHSIANDLIEKLSENFNLSAFSLPYTQDNDEIRTFLFGVFEAIDFQLKKLNKRLIVALPGSHHLPSCSWLPEKFPDSIRVFLTCK